MSAAKTVASGKYTTVRMLGEGSYGVVYEALHNELGRRVAIKRLHPGQASGEPLERFKREARICARLENPHIVAVHDFGEDAEGPFLVMELLRGRTLNDWILHEGPRPSEDVVQVMRQVLSALASAHAAGVVHRDVKPANIFLVESPLGLLAKVLDFGIAKLSEAAPLTRAGDMVGTITYMSPEQCRAEAIDARSDLYAVGVCMYLALSGERPFTRPNVRDTLVAIELGTCPKLSSLRPDLPPGLVEVVHKSFATAPADRYQTALELIDALAPFAPARAELFDSGARSASGVASSSGIVARGSLPPRSGASGTGPAPSGKGLVVGVVLGALVLVAAVVAAVATLSD
jgi:serine/threonine-protein kinase